MNEMERVWAQMKLTARELAATEAPPSLGRAEGIIWRIFYEQRAELPPAEALSYLAREMRDFVIAFAGETAAVAA